MGLDSVGAATLNYTLKYCLCKVMTVEVEEEIVYSCRELNDKTMSLYYLLLVSVAQHKGLETEGGAS